MFKASNSSVEFAFQCQLPQSNLDGDCILRDAHLNNSMLRDINFVSLPFALVGVTVPRAAER